MTWIRITSKGEFEEDEANVKAWIDFTDEKARIRNEKYKKKYDFESLYLLRNNISN